MIQKRYLWTAGLLAGLASGILAAAEPAAQPAGTEANPAAVGVAAAKPAAGGEETGNRLVRNGVVVHDGVIASVRRFKDDVKEVNAGMECGVLLADTNDIKPGDHLEVFEVEERARTL